MDFAELYRKAMGPKGLSANFDGQTQKQEKKMANKLIENKAFGFFIENETKKDVCIAIMPGAFRSLDDLQKRFPKVDAILRDGELYKIGEGEEQKKVTCMCRNGSTVKLFQSYFQSVVGVANTLEVITNKKENFQTEIEIGTPNPCEVEGLKCKTLSDYLGTQQYDQGRIIAKGINIPFSAIHMVLVTVKAGSNVTYTFTMETQF